MVEQTSTISDLISDSMDTIEAHETVRAAQRRMESQTLRSLIVVDDNRPVGVVKWRDLRSADGDETVATHMTTDFPVLRSGMEITEAHGHLGDVDFDNIPVIDENGQLQGQVPRGAIVHHEIDVDENERIDTTGEPAFSGADDTGFDLRIGMDVIDAEENKLGTLTEMSDDPTTRRLAHLVVEHGLLRKKHKRLPADTVSRVDGDNVILGITKMEWGFLADIEDDDV